MRTPMFTARYFAAGILALSSLTAHAWADENPAPRPPLPLTDLQVVVDYKKFDARYLMDWTWRAKRAHGRQGTAYLEDYVIVPGLSVVSFDPHYGAQALWAIRPVCLPYRWESGGRFAVLTDSTSAFVQDLARNEPVFIALDLSKPGARERLSKLDGQAFLFLLARDQDGLDAAVKYFAADASRNRRGGLAAYWFSPSLRDVPPNVETVAFDSCNLRGVALERMPKVRWLEFTHCENLDLTGISKAQRLEDLVLFSNAKIKGLSALAEARGLLTLKLIGSERLQDWLPYVKPLRGLRHLRLNLLGYGSLKELRHFGELESLSIRGWGKIDLAPLGSLYKLRILELTDVPTANTLPVIKYLEVLTIRGSFDVEEIPSLAKMTRLVYLDLRETSLPETAAIPKTPALKYFFPPEGWCTDDDGKETDSAPKGR